MSQIDWSKAPDWATHALVKLHNPNLGSVHWSCLIDGEHRVSPDGLWFHPDGYRVAEERPRKIAVKEWNGEGLPPVGMTCERRFPCVDGSSWQGGIILAHGSKKIFFRDNCGDEWAHSIEDVEFRPIRTPEQIAAEERNKAISEMMNYLGEDGDELFNAFGRMYDAGYRKFEIVEGE